MKRFLALLLLVLSSPAVTQQLDWTDAVNVQNTVINPTMNDCVADVNAPTCGAWKESTGFAPGDWTNQFGSTEYVFSYSQNKLYQDIDLSQYETNLFNFTFSFSLNNSCRNSIGGYCENVDGPIDFISAKIYFYDTNGLNNEFTFLNGNVSTARIECNFIDFFGLCIGGYSAYDQWQQFGWYSHVQSDALFTSARIEFEGRDAGFWGGLYGPRIDNPMLTINYMPPPYPTSGGGAGMNVSAPGSDYIFIYKGNDPVLFSQLSILGQDVVGWTAICEACGTSMQITAVSKPDPDYLFLYTDSIPTSGSYYSFQEQPPTVNCVTDPFDPSCVLTTLNIDDGIVDYSDPEEVAELLADEETGSDDGSDDGTEVTDDEEEIFVADAVDETTDELIDDETLVDETDTVSDDLEEMLADDESSDETEIDATPAVVATYRELTDEEKAAILADAISKNTLEGALSIASAAENNAVAQGASLGFTSESSSRTINTVTVAEITSDTTLSSLSSSSEMFVDNAKEESSGNDLTNSGADILDTGRQLGQAALAVTLAGASESATESVNQAENIAATVSAESQASSSASISSTIDTGMSTDISISSETKTEEIVVAEVQMETVVETPSENIEVNVAEIIQQSTESSAVDFTDMDVVMEMFAGNISSQIAAASQQELENIIIQQSVASVQEQQEETNTFSEAEAVTIANDPALANAFNMAPNMMNLEVTGVLSQKQEEKSDAEKAADKVVAANAKEQEEINKNYMDADQSGIVAAMGADTDVSSYRTAMLRDNNNWYKPEDIYKNVVIKDNVRGSYFLEKGNTDTYKKMVEEQYK